MKTNTAEVQKFPDLPIQAWETPEVSQIGSGTLDVFPDCYPRVVLPFGIEQPLNPSTHIRRLRDIQWIYIVKEYDSTWPVGNSSRFEIF